jgi:hypothetical protein
MDLELRVDSFATDLSQGLGKVAAGFVKDALFGMELAHSPRLSDIARALEEKIGLRATHKRLSRNAARSELAPIVSDNLLQQGASLVHDDTPLFLDWSTLLKNRAEKMEHLNAITDTKGNRVGRGYHFAEVVASEVDSDQMTPLSQSIWPETNPEAEFLSHTLELVARVRKACGGNKGILVADRSADHMGLLRHWTEDSTSRYLVRLRGQTELIYNRQIVITSKIAESCDTPYGKNVMDIMRHGTKPEFLHFGFKPVRLPVAPDRPLSLVVVRGVSPEPMTLLTTEPVRNNRVVLTALVAAYFRRWRIMSTKLRFYERHQRSKIRVLGFDGVRNLSILEFALASLHARIHNEEGSNVWGGDSLHVIEEGIDLYSVRQTEIPRISDPT